jgi:hypothetical protein
MSQIYSDANWNRGHIEVAISIGLFALPGLVLYFLVVFVIIRNPQSFRNNSFYSFILSLAATDILQTVTVILYLCPCIVLQNLFLGCTFDWIIGVGTPMLYYAGMATMVVIAVNRYTAVCHFKLYNVVFRKNYARAYLVGTWFFGFFIGIWQIGYGYSYTSAYNPNAWSNVYFIWGDHVLTITVFVTIITCYIAIIWKRPNKNTHGNNSFDRNETKRREKTERKLALQFGIIVLMFTMYQISMQFTAQVYDDLVLFVLAMFAYIAFISFNPLIYLAFNSDIRFHFLKLFNKNYSNNKVSSINLANSTINVGTSSGLNRPFGNLKITRLSTLAPSGPRMSLTPNLINEM